MMRKRTNILFVAFAVAVMITVALLPHHHHDGRLCTEIEYCEHDGCYNDEHTDHSADGTRCLGDTYYISAGQERSTGIIQVFSPASVMTAVLASLYDHHYHEGTPCRLYTAPTQRNTAGISRAVIQRGPPHLSL